MNNIKFKQIGIWQIPEDWELKELSEAIAINPNRILKKGQLSKKVSMDCLDPFTKKIKYFETSKFNGGSKFKNGDTLMARITPCLENGKTAFVDFLNNSKIGFGSTEFIVLSGKDGKTDNNFVYYLAISPELRESAILSMTGTSGRQRVQLDILGDTEINLPPLPEQKAIAKILSDLDSKIELNQQMNKTLEEIGKTLFKRWFVDFEFPNEHGKPYKSSGGEMVYNEELKKEIPKGWDVKLLKDLVLLNKRGIPPKYVSGGIPVLNQRCVRDKIIFNDASIQYHDPKKIINSELYLKSFDILINSMGVGTLGRISQASVVNDKYLVHSCITIIRADPQKISPFLLGYYFKDIQSMIEDLGEGSTGQTSLDNKKLDNLLVVVPDKKIQDKLDVLFNSIILEIGELDYENIKLAETRDLLLPKLMSGKIRVKYE